MVYTDYLAIKSHCVLKLIKNKINYKHVLFFFSFWGRTLGIQHQHKAKDEVGALRNFDNMIVMVIFYSLC